MVEDQTFIEAMILVVIILPHYNLRAAHTLRLDYYRIDLVSGKNTLLKKLCFKTDNLRKLILHVKCLFISKTIAIYNKKVTCQFKNHLDWLSTLYITPAGFKSSPCGWYPCSAHIKKMYRMNHIIN